MGRAALSVPSNIAEGNDRSSNKESQMSELLIQMGLDANSVKDIISVKNMQGMQMRLPWSIDIR